MHYRSGQSDEFIAESFARSRRRKRIFGYLVALALVALGLAAALLILFVRANARAVEIKYAWVQLLPDENGQSGGRLVRAIVAESVTCPAIREDGKAKAMQRRLPPARAAFPVAICEAKLKADSRSRLGDWTLPVRPAEPNGIVVLGDTGCRMTYYSQEQSCVDGKAWPFRVNALSAAKKVVSGQSFVLHLGDFHYREHACTDSSARCGGSPYGDNWDTWEAEFFEPADALLHAAPWVILRGNHEDCDRAGAGWLFFFALNGQKTTDAACDGKPMGYELGIGNTDDGRPRVLLVLDTSDEGNRYKIGERCEEYLELLEPLDRRGKEFWLAMHQPLWLRKMSGRLYGTDTKKLNCEESKSAISAIRDKFEDSRDRLARIALAGDTHAFQFFWPTDASTPIQIIAGHGGTALDNVCEAADVEETDKDCRGKEGNDRKYRLVKQGAIVRDPWVRSFGVSGSSLTFADHGFTVLQRSGSVWTAIQYNTAGSEVVSCRFSEAISERSRSDKPDCNYPW